MTDSRPPLLPDCPTPGEERTPPTDADAPSRIASDLRVGRLVEDPSFDRLLLPELRRVSDLFWTPVAAALRAAEWLDAEGVDSVVDIGAGAGKFCVVAALASRAHFTGLEQRPRLVAAARSLARQLNVDDRVEFIEGTFGADPLPRAAAYYLFNSFGENLFDVDERLDSDVELGDPRYLRDVRATERMLEDAPVGTFLLTYNGFGGRVPADFSALRVDWRLPCVLKLWRKELEVANEPEAPGNAAEGGLPVIRPSRGSRVSR